MSQDILNQIQEIFRNLIDEEDINLTNETTAEDVEDWDSLVHIQLVVAIEKQFKVKFTASEIEKFNKVGDIVDNVASKL